MDRKASSGEPCVICAWAISMASVRLAQTELGVPGERETQEHIAAQSLFCGEHFFVPCFCYALDCRGLSVGTI